MNSDKANQKPGRPTWPNPEHIPFQAFNFCLENPLNQHLPGEPFSCVSHCSLVFIVLLMLYLCCPISYPMATKFKSIKKT